jgi:cytochrome b6-f complex subunit 5
MPFRPNPFLYTKQASDSGHHPFLKVNHFVKTKIMVEPLLSGIVLGLVPVTIAGLLVTAYLQYRRGDSLNF